MKNSLFSSNKFNCKNFIFKAILYFCLIAFSGLLLAQPNNKQKFVFAHYMVCCSAAGLSPKLVDYMEEIRQAQQYGIDGFALNCGAWEKTDPLYKQKTILIYKAAEMLNSGFKLFVSLDRLAAKSEVDDVVNTVRNLPNQFYMDGRPVLSTFGGYKSSQDEKKFVDKVKKLNVFFVPYFFPRPIVKELPSKSDIENIANSYPELDGFFYFGAAGNPDELSKVNTINSDIWKSRGKVYMASVTPYYLGANKNFRVFETNGFTGMAKEWEEAIRKDVDWVQIVTWNDWYESSYVAPFFIDKENKRKWLPNGDTLPHVAYLEASQYYINWFKNRKKPTISKDEMYYFYRINIKSNIEPSFFMQNKSERYLPQGYDRLKDNVFVSLFLTAPAKLIIYSGNKINKFDLSFGVNHVSTSAQVGLQHFMLIRNKKVIIDKIGEKKIFDAISDDFNYFSGAAIAN